MNAWLLGTIALLAGGLVPAAWLSSRGDPVDRLIGLEFAGAVATPALAMLAHAVNRPSYLIVPLVLTLVSFAGTLVFTRLVTPPS